MTIAFLFVALFVLMFIGIPVAISLGLSGAMPTSECESGMAGRARLDGHEPRAPAAPPT